MKNIFSLGLLMAGFVFSVQASAVFFDDRGVFEASVGRMIVDDYEDPAYKAFDFFHPDYEESSDAGVTNVLGETRYISTAWLDSSRVPNTRGSHSSTNYYCAGCNGSFILDFTGTSLSDGNGVFGVGFEFFNRDFDTSTVYYNAFITYGDGSNENVELDESRSFIFGNFWGVTSDVRIASIAFGLAYGETTREGNFGIDNLTIAGITETPLPSSMSLFVIGLIGLGMLKRRKA